MFGFDLGVSNILGLALVQRFCLESRTVLSV